MDFMQKLNEWKSVSERTKKTMNIKDFVSWIKWKKTDKIIIFLFLEIGGCINASPAGKRRIAVGAEQQFSEDSMFNGRMNGGDPNNLFSRFGSQFSAITAIAVAACVLIVTLFGVIFALLQVSLKLITIKFLDLCEGIKIYSHVQEFYISLIMQQ